MIKKPGKLLIVDDDRAFTKALETVLHSLNFAVWTLGTGEEAVASVQTFRYEVVLPDITMPGMGGVETCRRLRKFSPDLGILMVTVHNSQEMLIQALDAGADDYVTKPFALNELVARLCSLDRRSRVAETRADAVITIGEIEIDPARRITKSGKHVHLTPKEFDLLCYLMSNAGYPITHARLLSAVWGSQYRQEVEYLRTFVRQSRKKLDDAADPRYLLAVFHFGYRFRANSDSPHQTQDLISYLEPG